MVVNPPQEAEASQNAPSTFTAWKKLPKDGDAIQAVHPVIDPSSWPTLADSSKKLPEPHSSESPSRSPTPETMSPPPTKTLPESASSSSMATASTSDSDQPIKIDAPPPPPQMPLHPRPSRSPAAQSQRSHHHRFSSSGNQRANAFQNSNFVNRRQQQARPHEWNSSRRTFVPRNFNQNQHYQYQPQGFGMQPAAMPIPSYPNSPTGSVPVYFAPPVQPPVMGYMLPYGYYGDQPFQDVYRPVYSSPSPYPDSIRAAGMHNLPHASYTPQEDSDVCNALLTQIEYYFSDVNLETDDYLKGQMDEQGWVSAHLIAGFKRVRRLTQDINLILKALRPSTVVEVQEHKLRKRGTWMDWVSSPVQPTQNKLVTSMQSLQLDGESGTESRAAEMQPVDNHPTVSTPQDGELGRENLNAEGQWSC